MTTEYKLTDDQCYPIGPSMTYNQESDSIEIPPSRIRGRISMVNHSQWDPPTAPRMTTGQFRATISDTGRLRVDNLGCLEFWLEIDMPEIMRVIQEHMYHPDGTIAQNLSHDFKGLQMK
jgi:hypothetical protein